MDAQHFDQFVRTIARTTNRRRLIASALGGLVFWKSSNGITAAQGDNSCGTHCHLATLPDGSTACAEDVSGMHRSQCAGMNDCGDGGLCAVGASAQTGLCGPVCGNPTCSETETLCNRACVDLASDTLNCGTCGNPCGGGEVAWGHAWACIESQCEDVCADNADYCGDACTDFTFDQGNCGGCGVVCGENTACCGGRCVDKSESKRFCGGCGMYFGFPQGCNTDETCQETYICVPTAGAPMAYDIGSWTCAETPPNLSQMIEPPIDGPTGQAYDLPGCTFDDGVTYVLYNAQDQEIARCEIRHGGCRIENVPRHSVARIEAQNLPGGVTPQGPGTTVGADALAIVINIASPSETPPKAPTKAPTEVPAKTGGLAFSIKAGEHWSIWVHDFTTGKNTRLADEPASDQFAPAFSHDGARIAYLSDEVDKVNQVWVMNADGSNKQQLSHYAGAGNLIHVAWGYNDTDLVMTELGAGGSNQLLYVPSDGGGGRVIQYTDIPAAWPSFSSKDTMAFVGRDGAGQTVIAMQLGKQLRYDAVAPEMMGGLQGVGEPSLSASGINLALDIGPIGARRVIAFGPFSDRKVPMIPAVGSDNGNPVWSPDETALAFVAQSKNDWRIVTYRLSDATAAPTPIKLPAHERVWYLSWSPVSKE